MLLLLQSVLLVQKLLVQNPKLLRRLLLLCVPLVQSPKLLRRLLVQTTSVTKLLVLMTVLLTS